MNLPTKQTAVFRLLTITLVWVLAHPVFAITLKIGTVSPEGSYWVKKFREGGEQVKAATAGRVKFKFYTGGVMGDDLSMLRKIRIGQLQGAAVTSGSLASFYPDNQIYSLPLKFQSYAEVDYVRQRMDSIIQQGLENNGFVSFGLAEGGFAYFMTNEPVGTLVQLNQQKVWAPDTDPIALQTLEAFDVKPIPLPIADVLAGLQTGMIDAVATSPIGALVLQWHTKVKYLTDVPVLYIYALLAVDNKAFAKIGPEDQQSVRTIMAQIFKEIDRQNRKDNVAALKTLINQGIEFIQPGPAARANWSAKAQKAIEHMVSKGSVSQGIYHTLEKHLADFRSQSSD